MRDLALTALVAGLIPFAVFDPFVGIALWTWLSVMNPHRMTWGFAYNLPFAQITAIATFVGLLVTHKKIKFPITPVTVTLILFMLWTSVTLVFAIHFQESVEGWSRINKTILMTLVAFAVVRSEKQIHILLWVFVLSVSYFGVKGGLFTIRGAGEERVWGPPNTYIEDNNALAIALVMMVPLLVYLYYRSQHRIVKLGLIVTTLLSAVSILGTYSRGAFVASTAVIIMLTIKSRRMMWLLIVLALALPIMLAAMPQKWWDRMTTITATDVDSSVQGRFDAWGMAWNLAKDRPLVGGGFAAWEPDVYAIYGPNPNSTRASHSIYFQLLGEHGFVGLALFLLLGALAWRTGTRVIRASVSDDTRWRANLARALQVSMVGYFVGGLTVHMTYWDGYYYLLVLLVALAGLAQSGVSTQRIASTSAAVSTSRLQL